METAPPGASRQSSRVVRSRRRRVLSVAAAAALAPIILLTSGNPASAVGSICNRANVPYMKGDWTKAIVTQEAKNTWEDWIWRGPIYQCNGAVPSCTHTWNVTKSTSVPWSIGLIIGVQNDPTTRLAQLIPSYGRTTTRSSSFTSGVTLLPGQYAQPVQVVLRRWQGGNFEGAWVRDRRLDSTCNGRMPGVGYRWDGGVRWGSWSHNIRLFEFDKYHVWR